MQFLVKLSNRSFALIHPFIQRTTNSILDVFHLSVPALMGINLALGKPTSQSSTASIYFSSLAVDGILNTNAQVYPYCTGTADPAGSPNWWMVDLQQTTTIGYVVLTNRADCCSKDDHARRYCI